MKIKDILESSSGGSTSSGSIASLPGAGGPMMPIISRMKPGESFFAPAQYQKKEKKKKSSKS